jgi:hypothetical protein
LRGVAADAFGLRVDEGLSGVALAGFWIEDHGPAQGIVASGLALLGGGDLEGVALAGGVAVRRDVRGIEAAPVTVARDVLGIELGVVDVARGVQGIQASTVGVAHGVTGVQMGVVDVAARIDGLQAGVVNGAAEGVGGLQAGVVNGAVGIDGLQVGVVNVGGHVRGAQIGVVNIADTVDGVSLGLVSLARNGRVEPIAWASTDSPANAGVRFQVGWLYSELGMGVVSRTAGAAGVPEVGLGTRIAVGPCFVAPGVHYSEEYTFSSTHGGTASRRDVRYRVTAGIDLRVVSLFVGGALVQPVTGPESVHAELLAGALLF